MVHSFKERLLYRHIISPKGCSNNGSCLKNHKFVDYDEILCDFQPNVGMFFPRTFLVFSLSESDIVYAVGLENEFLRTQRIFYMIFYLKNGCKNEFKDIDEKSRCWSRNRVSQKIDFKVQWLRNSHADSVGVNIENLLRIVCCPDFWISKICSIRWRGRRLVIALIIRAQRLIGVPLCLPKKITP